MVLIDVVFLGILLFAAYRGYKKGLLGTLSRVAGYIISLIATLLLYHRAADFLGEQLNLREKLSPWVAEKLALPASTFQTKISSIAMDRAEEIINSLGLPKAFQQIMLDYVKDFSALPSQGINTLGEGVTYTLSTLLISALSFFLLYTCLALIFRIILPKLFGTVSPKPLTFLDKLGGALLGAGGGVLSVAALIILLTPVASMGALKGNISPLANQMMNSVVVNIFMDYLKKIL